jgi:hypothetical protein
MLPHGQTYVASRVQHAALSSQTMRLWVLNQTLVPKVYYYWEKKRICTLRYMYTWGQFRLECVVYHLLRFSVQHRHGLLDRWPTCCAVIWL